MNVDLAFEGGGTKGIAHAGAVQALEEANITIRRSVGASAGAIAALLVQLGYSSAQMLDLLTERVHNQSRFYSFFDTPERFPKEVLDSSLLMQELRANDIPLVPEAIESRIDKLIIKCFLQGKLFRQFFSLIECGGLFAGATFVEWLEKSLQQRGYRKDTTLVELPNLSVVVADITARERLVLNAHTAPHVPVAWAVRASMSIPLLWQSVRWLDEWGTYLGRNMTGHELVDGGLCSDFPLRLLVEPCVEMAECSAVPVIGLLLDEELALPNAHKQAELCHPLKRVQNIVETLLEGNDRSTLKTYEQNVCRLPCQGYGTLEDVQGDELKALCTAARRATREHCKKRPDLESKTECKH